MEIRHIAAARDVPIVAVGAWKYEIEVWNAKSATKISSFPTQLEPGGQRLAISHDGTRVAAAAFEKHGLSMFEGERGQLAWTRSDLQQIQKLTWSHDGGRIYCGVGNELLHRIDITSGATLETIEAVSTRIDSPFGNAYLLDGEQLHIQLKSGKSFSPRRETFAVLDAVFGVDTVAIAESGGSVRILSLDSGRDVVRYTPENGVHALQLAYCAKRNAYLALLWPYQHGGSKRLVKIDSTSGRVSTIAVVGQPAETGFSTPLGALVCSTGELVDLESGRRRSFRQQAE
jgi:WD40 repeat protein